MSNDVAAPPVGDALKRLKRSVSVCCTIVGLSLVVQLVVWSLVTYTDLRFKEVEPENRPEMVITPDMKVAPLKAVGMETVERIMPGPVTIHSKYDLFFRDLTALTLALGTVALVVLVFLVTVTTVIIAAASAPGVDEVVSALIWVVILSVLTLPLGGIFHFPWSGSGLRAYPDMIEQIEIALAKGPGLSFFASFLVLPVLCLGGIMLMAWRFSVAISKGLPNRQPFLDPELEKEVARVSMTSLHGGRAGVALSNVVEPADAATPAVERQPPARPVMAGVGESTPRRPI